MQEAHVRQRDLNLQVALEELGRVCKGYEDDLASLKAALTAGQPASPAESGEILDGYHADINPALNGNPSAPSQPMDIDGRKGTSNSCSDAPLAALRKKAKLPKEASPSPVLSQSSLPLQSRRCSSTVMPHQRPAHPQRQS